MDCIHLAPNREKWRTFVNTVMTLRVLYARNLLTLSLTYYFIDEDFTPWSKLQIYSDCPKQIMSDVFYEKISVFNLQLLKIIIIIIYK